MKLPSVTEESDNQNISIWYVKIRWSEDRDDRSCSREVTSDVSVAVSSTGVSVTVSTSGVSVSARY